MRKLRKYPDLSERAAHAVGADDHLERGLRQGTGNTPDGRRKGEPFAPGANPMHGRDSHGIQASAASVAKIPYRDAAGRDFADDDAGSDRPRPDRGGPITNLTSILDGFFGVDRLST